MKRTMGFFVVMLLLSSCQGIVKNPIEVSDSDSALSSALAYNNYIVKKQLKIQQLSQQVVQESKADLIMAGQTIDSAYAAASNSLEAILNMPAWNGSTALRDSAAQLFRFYKEAFANDYKLIIEIQKDGIITPEEDTTYSQVVHRIDSVQTGYDAAFRNMQQQFAKVNGFPVKTLPVSDTTVKP